MALHLARPKHRSFANPSLKHLFSTSSNSGDGFDGDNNRSPVSACLSGIRARLRNQQERETSASPISKPNSVTASLDELHNKLSHYTRKSTAESSPTKPPFSFSEAYQKNVSEQQKLEPLSFGTIKDSLHQLGSKSAPNTGNKIKGPFFSLNDLQHTFQTNPSDVNAVLPKPMKESTPERDAASKTEFVRIYTHSELGERLMQLRPEKKEGERWFSLQELNERLVKLREVEQKEAGSRITPFYHELRMGLSNIHQRKVSSKFLDHF